MPLQYNDIPLPTWHIVTNWAEVYDTTPTPTTAEQAQTESIIQQLRQQQELLRQMEQLRHLGGFQQQPVQQQLSSKDSPIWEFHKRKEVKNESNTDTGDTRYTRNDSRDSFDMLRFGYEVPAVGETDSPDEASLSEWTPLGIRAYPFHIQDRRDFQSLFSPIGEAQTCDLHPAEPEILQRRGYKLRSAVWAAVRAIIWTGFLVFMCLVPTFLQLHD